MREKTQYCDVLRSDLSYKNRNIRSKAVRAGGGVGAKKHVTAILILKKTKTTEQSW